MLGAVFGDIIGSYYEVHCTKNYDFEFYRDSSFTDDSVMTAAVCRAILANPDAISRLSLRKRAFEYAAHYRQLYSYFPHAGYGNMFIKWAEAPKIKIQHSYGNGGAMRAVPIGYAYDTLEQVLIQAKASCFYTHNSYEAINAAQAVAAAVWLADNGFGKNDIRTYLQKEFRYKLDYTINDIRDNYSFDSRAGYSVPPAIVAFLDSHDYESAVRNAISLGGDADTMACISGGIAEAFYREIPEHIRKFCSIRLDSAIKKTADYFCRKYMNTGTSHY